MIPTKLIRTIKAIAIAILVLGLIHVVATFTPLVQQGLSCLSVGDFNAMLFMSLVCGASFILCGGLIWSMLRNKEELQAFKPLFSIIGAFLLATGVLAVYLMFNNPFAWMSFLLNGLMFFLLLSINKKLSSKA